MERIMRILPSNMENMISKKDSNIRTSSITTDFGYMIDYIENEESSKNYYIL